MYCDRPQLGEFGGYGVFISDRVRVSASSQTALSIGEPLDKALQDGDLDRGAAILAYYFNSLLEDVSDASVRDQLRLRIAADFSRAPVPQENADLSATLELGNDPSP
jgi:hypothetical protein